jgi:hypothetical protein
MRLSGRPLCCAARLREAARHQPSATSHHEQATASLGSCPGLENAPQAPQLLLPVSVRHLRSWGSCRIGVTAAIPPDLGESVLDILVGWPLHGIASCYTELLLALWVFAFFIPPWRFLPCPERVDCPPLGQEVILVSLCPPRRGHYTKPMRRHSRHRSSRVLHHDVLLCDSPRSRLAWIAWVNRTCHSFGCHCSPHRLVSFSDRVPVE